VEAAEVKVLPQRVARVFAQPLDFPAPHFVRASLAWPNYVAIDLGGDSARLIAGGGGDIIDRLLA